MAGCRSNCYFGIIGTNLYFPHCWKEVQRKACKNIILEASDSDNTSLITNNRYFTHMEIPVPHVLGLCSCRGAGLSPHGGRQHAPTCVVRALSAAVCWAGLFSTPRGVGRPCELPYSIRTAALKRPWVTKLHKPVFHIYNAYFYKTKMAWREAGVSCPQQPIANKCFCSVRIEQMFIEHLPCTRHCGLKYLVNGLPWQHEIMKDVG